MVVVGDATEAGMANLVDRVRVLAGELEGAAIDDGKLTPLLSAGWIVRTPSAEDTLAQLIDRADAEMYVDKSARQARRQK